MTHVVDASHDYTNSKVTKFGLNNYGVFAVHVNAFFYCVEDGTSTLAKCFQWILYAMEHSMQHAFWIIYKQPNWSHDQSNLMKLQLNNTVFCDTDFPSQWAVITVYIRSPLYHIGLFGVHAPIPRIYRSFLCLINNNSYNYSTGELWTYPCSTLWIYIEWQYS